MQKRTSATTPSIGVFLPTLAARGHSPGDVAATARHAEALGLDSVWVVDQLIAGTGTPVLDAPLALAAAAGATDRVELGIGVAILPLRPVVWLAKREGQHALTDSVDRTTQFGEAMGAMAEHLDHEQRPLVGKAVEQIPQLARVGLFDARQGSGSLGVPR